MKLSFREWLESLVPLNPLGNAEIHRIEPANIQIFQNGLRINNSNLSLDKLQMKDLMSHMSYVPDQAFDGTISIRKPQGLQSAILTIKGYNNRDLGHCNLTAAQAMQVLEALKKAA